MKIHFHRFDPIPDSSAKKSWIKSRKCVKSRLSENEERKISQSEYIFKAFFSSKWRKTSSNVLFIMSRVSFLIFTVISWVEPSPWISLNDRLLNDASFSVSSSFLGVIVSCRRKSRPGVKGENVVVGTTSPDCLLGKCLPEITGVLSAIVACCFTSGVSHIGTVVENGLARIARDGTLTDIVSNGPLNNSTTPFIPSRAMYLSILAIEARPSIFDRLPESRWRSSVALCDGKTKYSLLNRSREMKISETGAPMKLASW